MYSTSGALFPAGGSSQDKGIQVVLLFLHGTVPWTRYQAVDKSQHEPVLEKLIRGHPFLGREHPKDPCFFFGSWNGAIDRDAGI